MRRYRASWLLPVTDDPVRDGWVEVDKGRITAVGRVAPGGTIDGDTVDLGARVVLPALVNAHTHLELSYLRGRIPPAERFVDWIRAVMQARRGYPDAADPVIVEAARAALRQAQACGTGLLGDISNTLVTIPLLGEHRIAAQVFLELLGFSEPDPAGRVAAAQARIAALTLPEDVRVSLAAHAPYSVSPALFAAIRRALDAHGSPISSVHLGESIEEVELLKRGTGGFRTLLTELGVWTDEWQPPGVSPVVYLWDLGFLDRAVLAVHGVQFDGEDLSRLGALGVTVVSCPRSNQYVGVGAPPLEAFYAMDVDVAFGTDSLASAEDMNIFAELHEARRLAPRVPARRLLESATLTGARALGFDRDFGSIEPGKRAALIAVRVPQGVSDVEEYLLSGVGPEAITWLAPDA